MNFILRSSILIFLLQIITLARVCKAVGTPCRAGTTVGDDPAKFDVVNTEQPYQDHGAIIGTVLFDPIDTIQCCGVVTQWRYRIYNPGAYTSATDSCDTCQMDFIVWRNITLAQNSYTAVMQGVNAQIRLIDQNQIKAIPPSYDYYEISIPQNQQIPVQPDYYIGFNGATVNGIQYVDDSVSPLSNYCNTPPYSYSCTALYMQTAPGTGLGTLVPKQPYTFKEVGAIDQTNIDRYYAFRAVLDRGAFPQFSDLPAAISIPSTTAIGTVVYQVNATDANTLDVLTTTLLRTCPSSTPFSYDPITGLITVNGSLASYPYLTHTLEFDVSDQCQNNQSTLTITVIPPVAATNTVTPANGGNTGLLSTTDGQALVGLLAAALAVTLAALIAMCCMCYLLGGLGKICGNIGGGASASAGGQAMVQSPTYQYYQPVSQPNYQIVSPPREYYVPREYIKPNYVQPEIMEPRPPSYNLNEFPRPNNRVRPVPEPVREIPQRDINVRPVSQNQYTRDQLFW